MSLELDQDGHLVDYTIWDEPTAQQLAKNLGIELTEWHFQVLHCIRQFYAKFGYSPSTRPLIKFLTKELGENISNATLQKEFNTGLVARHLTRLAGLPKPPNCL